MPLKKGDLIDERKRHPDSCGLVVKVMDGGAGFEKIICCDHELTDEDVVPEIRHSAGRKRGVLPLAVVLDEKKLYPDSCGLRVMIMDGGAGFKEIRCCGHSLTMSSMRELKYGALRGAGPGEESDAQPNAPAGTA
ncbi:conserved protein of unknown function [Nitrospira japonica]|uniref:Uncharacterized protein n=1 Tax=Nitrospira japonica TaxID=1325564 RepID=A0A1W1I3B5_9BACT|nr:hypothetical protein [Nitrospira japonica]SLM47492.1 conserved protein of unknown function [Nitrospira japonica]